MIPRNSRSLRAGLAFVLGFGSVWLASGSRVTAGGAAIPWREDFQQAQNEARAQNRPLWIQFTGPWCHFCTRMERETLIHPQVIDHARESFIPVKLQSDVHEDLALRYGLTGLPATIIVKPSGEVVAKHEGFLEAADFQALLRTSLSRCGSTRPTTSSPARVEAPALGGYCLVSLVADRKLVPGQAAVSFKYQGRVYRFANDRARDRFQKHPERYVPINGGQCPVNQVDRGDARAGDPRWGALYGGHLYLCADEASRTHFLKHPGRYTHVNVADREFCPHCWARDSLVARGQAPFSLAGTSGSQRALLPGPLEAYRNSAETLRR